MQGSTIEIKMAGLVNDNIKPMNKYASIVFKLTG